MAREMNLLSLNSEGAFRTTMQRRIPQTRKESSTANKERNLSNHLSNKHPLSLQVEVKYEELSKQIVPSSSLQTS